MDCTAHETLAHSTAEEVQRARSLDAMALVDPDRRRSLGSSWYTRGRPRLMRRLQACFGRAASRSEAGQRLRSRRHRLLRILCTWRILAGTGVRSPGPLEQVGLVLQMGAPLYTLQADDRHACSGIPWQGFAQRLPSCPHSSVGKRLCRGGCTWGLACSLSKGHGQISGAAISPCHSGVKCMLQGSG